MGIACRIALSLLTLTSLGAGSAFAAGAERDFSANEPRVAIEATDAGGGLELRVNELDSSIAAIAATPMAPGEIRSGEFRVGTDESSAAIMALVATTEVHGGSDGRGCFEHQLTPPGEAAAFTPYGGVVAQPLHEGRSMQTYRISIRMARSCVPTTERPVSGTLVLRLVARGS